MVEFRRRLDVVPTSSAHWVASISSDGLLIVKQTEPLTSCRERIIVPRSVLPGLLTALHIRLNHPTIHQLKQVFNRYFFALDADNALSQCINSCHECASIRTSPKFTQEQTTSSPPESVGCSFAADVIRVNRQLILLLRETVTSFTATCLIPSEDRNSLRDGLISLTVELRPLDGPYAVIRTDPAPGFTKLREDELLRSCRINLDKGRIKNKNKNPVAEKAIQELEHELLRVNPNNNMISTSILAIATANLNTRIRHHGLSSRELWSQRDQFTNCQLPVNDQQVIKAQHDRRISNHRHSEKSKGGRCPSCPSVQIGDIVYLHTDRNKSQARRRYLVVSIDKPFCIIRKFVGNQLRSTGYKVLLTECYSIEKTDVEGMDNTRLVVNDEDEEDTHVSTLPPALPILPREITAPQSDYNDDLNGNVQEIENDKEDQDKGVPRRSARQRKAPGHLKDYEVSLT